MKDIANITDLILKSSLYDFVEIHDTNLENIFKFLTETNVTQFDCYCIDCEKDTPFKLSKSDYKNHPKMKDIYLLDGDKRDIIASADRPQNLIFSCQRDFSHELAITLKSNDLKLVKIGQYPSIASIEKHDIGRYKKLLHNDYENLNRAIGLYSHGVGAGSYVYLRRIFEKLIEEIHIKAKEESDWNDEKYNKSRMKEKIELLEHLLPSILVETPQLYGILSIGIHELSEEECRNYFPIMKTAIELILDEKLALLIKEAKSKDLKKSLDAIATKISK